MVDRLKNLRCRSLALLLLVGLTAELCAETKPKAEMSSTSERITQSQSGATQYDRLCSGCHGSDGLALAEEAPPLAGSSWVSGPEERLIRIIRNGMRGPVEVADKTYDREMPGIGYKLSDREMASLVSFVRNRWGASTASTKPEAIRKVRAASKNRNRYWTVEELLRAP